MNRSDPQPAKLRRYAPVLIFVIAFIVRLAYLAECTAQPFFGSQILDSRYILAQADYVLNVGHFPPEPFFRPPLYTLFVAGLRRLAGQDIAFWVALIQHLLGAAFSVLCWSACVLCGRPVAGAFAGLAAALYAPLVFYEGEMLSDAPALFLYMAFLVTWTAAVQKRTLYLFAVSGLICGLAAITRPNIVLVAAAFPVLYIAGAVVGRKGSSEISGEPEQELPLPNVRTRFRLAGVFLFLLFFILIVAVPSVHNARTGDYNFIASQGGINFYVGNSRLANGTNVVIPRHLEAEEEYQDAVEEYGKLGFLIDRHGFDKGYRLYQAGESIPKPSTLSRFWYRRGIDDLFADRRHAIALYVRKLTALINNYEVRNNKDFSFARQHLSTSLRMIPFTFGCIFPFAVLGAWHVLRSRNRGGIWVVAYTILIGAGIILYFVAGRLRLPFLAGAFVLAGFGFDKIVTLFQSMRAVRDLQKASIGSGQETVPQSIIARQRLHALIVAIVFVVSAAFSFYQFPQLDFRMPVQQSRGNHGIYTTSWFPEEWTLTAIAAMEAGRPNAAEKYARAALEEAPNLSYAHLVLGNALYAQQKLHEAGWAYRKAHENDPESARPIANLAAVAIDQGKTTAAVTLLRHALVESPGNVAALANLAALHLRAGQAKEARVLATRALQSAPGHTTALAVMAIIEQRPDIPDSCKRDYQELLQLMEAAPLDPIIFEGEGDLKQAILSTAPSAPPISFRRPDRNTVSDS